MMVAAAEKGLTKKAMAEWTAYLAKGKASPMMETLREFLLQKAEELDEEDTTSKTPVATFKHSAAPSKPYNPGRKPARNAVLYTKEFTASCKMCNDAHHVLYQCSQLKSLTVDQRQSTVQRLKVCTNCLGSDHLLKNCFSKRSCRTCGRKHHTLLHRGDQQPSVVHQQSSIPSYPTCSTQTPQQKTPNQLPSQPQGQVATLSAIFVSTTDPVCNTTASSNATILGTCVTTVESQGKLQKARALMDNSSSVTFITSRMVNSLKMRKIAESTSVTGFQQTVTPISKYKVEFHLRIPSGTVTVLIPVQVVVVDVITGDLPSGTLTNVKQSPFLQGLPLADPGFNKPGRVDLLLGVNVLPRVMLEGRVHSSDFSMSATNTVYGWVVTGTCASSSQAPRSHHCLKTQLIDQQTQDFLVPLWNVEDVSSATVTQTEEEVAALEHFQSTHSRQDDGRYVVKLPRKMNILALGCSREQAIRRYLQNEKSLNHKGNLPTFLTAVQDYALRGHAERVPPEDLRKPETDTYYLPMHGVVKEASTTTKLCVVFDASAKTSSGVSLMTNYYLDQIFTLT